MPIATCLKAVHLMVVLPLFVSSCTSAGGGGPLGGTGFSNVSSGGQNFQVLDNSRRRIVSVGRAPGAGGTNARTRRAARAYLASTKPSCRLGPLLADNGAQRSYRYSCR